MTPASRFVHCAVTAFFLLAGEATAKGQQADSVLALTHVHVLPMSTDTLHRDQTLIIRDGRIDWLGPATSARIPPSAATPAVRGAYVMPGLIDAHVHLREPSIGLLAFPAFGVTTVVNLEGSPHHLALRDSVLTGELLGPRILSSGPYLERVASGPDAARNEVRRQHHAGYDLIKIHGDIERSTFEATLAEAGSLGLPVLGHAPSNLPLGELLRSDFAALAHAEELLDSELVHDPETISADSIGTIADSIVASGTAIITTLHFFTGMRKQAGDQFFVMIQWPELAYVSPERHVAWLNDGHREYIEPDELPWYDAAVDVLHSVIGEVRARGGTVIAGTDTPLEFTVPGASLHRELEHLQEAGLSSQEALRAATAAPAELLGRDDIGVIREGATADLLVLTTDPRTDLSVLRDPDGVVLRGRWLPREALRRALDSLAATYARDRVMLEARDRVRQELRSMLRGDSDAGLKTLISDFRSGPSAGLIEEPDLNTLGYDLLHAGDVERAIEIFRMNVELYPESANVHDSLGEALLSAGQLDAAERSYERALAMDPKLDSAERGLEEIGRRRAED